MRALKVKPDVALSFIIMSCQNSIGLLLSILQLLPDDIGFNIGYIAISAIVIFWIQTLYDSIIAI